MPVRDHIHLSDTLGAGPENAPDKKWAIRFQDYAEIPDVVMSAQRTLSGVLEVHVLKSAGVPIRFKNYSLILKLSDENEYALTALQRWEQLMALNGSVVYFCHNSHAADGADHTADVKTYLVRLNAPKWESPLLQLGYVTVDLIDAHTVPAP